MTAKSTPTSPPEIQELVGYPPSPEALRDLAALREAVAHELDRKKRLGHSAVFGKDGAVQIVPPEELPTLEESRAAHASGQL